MSNVIPSPTIMGISAWAISPASAGSRFWCTNNNTSQNVDSLKTPAGNKTNFSLGDIQTPSGLFSNFWTSSQNGLETPKLLDNSKETGTDSDFVDLDTSKPEPSNNVLDCITTPKITEQTRREVNLGDYSIVQETHVSLVPNRMINTSSLPVFKQEEPAPKRQRLVQLATPNTIHQNFKLQAVHQPSVKLEAPSQPCSPLRAAVKAKNKQPKEKKYACQWANCTKAFYRADELKRHTRVHTKEKPFPCPHCDRHFARSDHVRTHVRIHTGEKPYKCSFCPKSFARSDERLRHHKVHEKRQKKEQEAKNNARKMEVMGYCAPPPKYESSRASTPASYHSYQQAPPRAIQYATHVQAPVMINGSPVVQSQTYYPDSRNASYDSSTQYGYYN